jgi:hypothetical protein
MQCARSRAEALSHSLRRLGELAVIPTSSLLAGADGVLWKLLHPAGMLHALLGLGVETWVTRDRGVGGLVGFNMRGTARRCGDE